MTDPQLLTSKRNDWETPTPFWNALHEEFEFDLDAAAHELNAKLDHFYTEDDNALKIDWEGKCPWCNPPYGRGNNVGKWCEKFATEAMRPNRRAVVSLVAARTDTLWFHDLIWELADEVRWVRGRLLFELDGKTIQKADKKGVLRDMPATFPSMVVVWRRRPVLRVGDHPCFRQMLSDGTVLNVEEVPL